MNRFSYFISLSSKVGRIDDQFSVSVIHLKHVTLFLPEGPFMLSIRNSAHFFSRPLSLPIITTVRASASTPKSSLPVT